MPSSVIKLLGNIDGKWKKSYSDPTDTLFRAEPLGKTTAQGTLTVTVFNGT
jgi:hypothetical protein